MNNNEKKWTNFDFSNVGLFLLVLLLGIGTQQAIIQVTANKVAEVTQLDARAAASVKSVAEASAKLASLQARLDETQLNLEKTRQQVSEQEAKLAQIPSVEPLTVYTDVTTAHPAANKAAELWNQAKNWAIACINK